MTTTDDKTDGKVLVTLQGPAAEPFGLAWDGEHLWVSDRKERKIHRIDSKTGQVLFSIAFDGELTGTAWDGSHVWQADQTSRTISRIDTETGSIDLAIKVDLMGGDITGLSCDVDAEGAVGLWYGLARLGQIRKVKAEDGTFIRAFPCKAGVCGIAPVGRDIYYTEPAEGVVNRMHAGTGSLLFAYRVGGKPAGLCHDGECFWIADQDSGEIKRIQF